MLLQLMRIPLLLLTGLACVLSGGATSFGQEPARGFVDRVFTDEQGDHKYVVFVPNSYTPDRVWPVILFLHGAGECGSDGKLQTTVGLGPYISAQPERFPFIVVFPQCEDTKGRILQRWRADQPDGARALKILDEVEKTYHVDSKRRSLIGWSMGGYGAWALGAHDPARWNTVVPISGGGDEAEAAQLKDTPVWAFHGAQDAAVKVEESRKMVAALKAAGGKPHYTEVADLGHEAFKVVFDRPEFFRWLMNPTTDNETPLLVQPGTRITPPPPNAPFIPAVHIPRAGYVRLGNDMLQTLADSIPRIVPAEMLTGGIGDISQSIQAEGRTFSVWFQGIGYRGQLYRAAIQAYAPERVNIQLGISNLLLTINSTSVAGAGKSAWAGPIGIYIGRQRPVWLSFDVRPYIDQGRIRLQLLATRFEIPYDDFVVTNPAGVATRGLGMTAERVTTGLTEGIYGQKGRIEAAVREVVPSLVAQLEQRLSLSEIDQVGSTVWPIPVVQPRVRMWAQEISSDDKGITLVLGATAAALSADTAPKEPKWAPNAGPAAAEVPKLKTLTVGLAPGVLTPLAEMLVEKGIARVNVLDTPLESLKSFANPALMSEVIPDLKRYGESCELWADLILSEPLGVKDADGKMQFAVPGLMVSLAVKPDQSAKDWQPLAEIQFDISQPATPEVVSPTPIERAVQLTWNEDPQLSVSARFAPDYQPENDQLDTARMEDMFRTSWKEWTTSGTSSQIKIPDIDLGFTKLRLKDVQWSAPTLNATFGNPGVRVSNLSSEPIVYETKGPYSDWSKPYTLQAGDYDAFNIAYPLLFRRQKPDGQIEYFTLPVGSHSEFRKPTEGGHPMLFQARDTVVTAPAPPTTTGK